MDTNTGNYAHVVSPITDVSILCSLLCGCSTCKKYLDKYGYESTPYNCSRAVDELRSRLEQYKSPNCTVERVKIPGGRMLPRALFILFAQALIQDYLDERQQSQPVSYGVGAGVGADVGTGYGLFSGINSRAAGELFGELFSKKPATLREVREAIQKLVQPQTPDEPDPTSDVPDAPQMPTIEALMNSLEEELKIATEDVIDDFSRRWMLNRLAELQLVWEKRDI